MDKVQPNQAVSETADTSPGAFRARNRSPLTPLTLVAIVAPGIVVFVLPGVSLIARNEEFFAGEFMAGRVLYVLALISTAVGVALWALSTTTTGRFLFFCYVLITPGWVLYSVPLDGRRAMAALIVAVLVLGGAYALTRWRRSAFVGISLISAMILAGAIGTTMLEVQAADAEQGGPQVLAASDTTPISGSLPNAYHIVFDEFQTEMFETTLDARVREALSGFVYFPDARTPYGRTEMSMASVFGPADYDYGVTPQDFVDSSLRGPESSLEHVRDAGYHITGYTLLESLYGPPQPFDATWLFKEYVGTDPGSDYAQLATSLWVYSRLPDSIAKRLIPEENYEQFSGENLLPPDSPALSAEAFRTFINRERQLPATGRYSLLHLILPHFPYVLSRDCEYEVGLESTPTAQAECATSLLVSFLDELRTLDRFNDSTIIIHSDHGARFELDEQRELRRVKDSSFEEQWRGARSRSLLLVKPAQADSSAELAVSDYPALITDVMATVFDSIDVPFEVSEGRTSLLSDALPARDVRHYHFYDKGPDGLPDGELFRFDIIDGVVSGGETITLPIP